MADSITVGAVGAAIVAGAFSLISLINTKEQKVSEFRQAWVDALRNEITDYLTNINAISDALNMSYDDFFREPSGSFAFISGIECGEF